MRKPMWRWSNVPVPEPYLVTLAAGVVVDFVLPANILPSPWLGHAWGWPVLVIGLLLAAWAVRATRHVDIAKPSVVISSGPYRFSRNPMYLAWTCISLSMGLIVNSVWVVLFVSGALLFVAIVTVPREERELANRLGEAYAAYRRRVRRWI